MTDRQKRIQERLDRIVAEGKSPTVSSDRKEILRRFYRFWKEQLDMGEKSMINIEPLKPMVFEYLSRNTHAHGYFSLPELLSALPATESMMTLALQELVSEKKILEESNKWACPLTLQK